MTGDESEANPELSYLLRTRAQHLPSDSQSSKARFYSLVIDNPNMIIESVMAIQEDVLVSRIK